MGSAGTPSSFMPYFSTPASNSSSTAKGGKASSSFSPAVIAIVGILGAAFLLVSYYTMMAKFCRGRLPFNRRSMRRNVDEEEVLAGVTWAVVEEEQAGVEEAVIQAIPVVEYRKWNWKEGSTNADCGVCLSQFEEEERVRLLPTCSHAFHLPCIDKWLHSHVNCPLCRALISITPVDAQPASPTSDQAMGGSENTAADDCRLHILDDMNLREGAQYTPSTPKLQSLDREQFIKTVNRIINARQARGQNVGGATSDGLSKEEYPRLQLLLDSGFNRCFSTGRPQGFLLHMLNDHDAQPMARMTTSSSASSIKSMGVQRSSSHS